MSKTAVVVTENNDVIDVYLLPSEAVDTSMMRSLRDRLAQEGMTNFYLPGTLTKIERRVYRVVTREVSNLREVFQAIQESE